MRRSLLKDHSTSDDVRCADGLCLDGLGARVLCPENVFPPSHQEEDLDEDTVYITINVVRKSDGMVSPFMPRHALLFNSGYSFNDPEPDENEPRRWFAENPQLQGYLPWTSQIPGPWSLTLEK